MSSCKHDAYFFQPLDLTFDVEWKIQNLYAQKVYRKQYSRQILDTLENKCEVMYVTIDVKFTISKLLHAKWLSEFYNYINSSNDQESRLNSWFRFRITDAIKMGSSKLPSLDPFLEICSDIDFVIWFWLGRRRQSQQWKCIWRFKRLKDIHSFFCYFWHFIFTLFVFFLLFFVF